MGWQAIEFFPRPRGVNRTHHDETATEITAENTIR
jgi:hypothetical protein